MAGYHKGDITPFLDRNGNRIYIGDKIRFDPREWGGENEFIMSFNNENGEWENPGTTGDLDQWCDVIERVSLNDTGTKVICVEVWATVDRMWESVVDIDKTGKPIEECDGYISRSSFDPENAAAWAQFVLDQKEAHRLGRCVVSYVDCP